MSTIGTLYTIDRQDYGKRLKAIAALAGLPLDVPSGFVFGETNKSPEYLAKFPHGKIPTLETKDGFKLFETQAIARYLASLAPNSTLQGSSAKEAALVDQWTAFADSELNAPGRLVSQLVNGMLSPYTRPLHLSFLERVERALGTLEQHLKSHTFLVTERITLADITLASIVQRQVGDFFDASLRAKYPSVIRHLETVINQPSLIAAFGPAVYIEKAKQFTPPPKEKKETKPAAAPAPKAEKKPKAKEVDDEEEDDLVPKEEPKAKNPLDSLPKSNFNLEDWKRAYSNKETRGADGAIEWFYQNYDPKGFSVWRVDFKYNNELTQTFMSSNQIGGFFNRLEASRKYLFGSVGVLGQTNDSVIAGTLITRGPDIKPVVEVAPDWESYEYKKLDLSNAADKAFFEAALAWDLEVDGKKWVDGKNFK
ncbi:elongation factor 1-gamma [Daedalea quercina L-15889]|uniref:Elongation factor 1-gamma n=1 Tax=Daedalea quercina L-15889 TaxID=1314783 RepID=A0A165NC49_9APHY|nr:elongation factor 1-gamma [Daedalea quercina L-15889]